MTDAAAPGAVPDGTGEVLEAQRHNDKWQRPPELLAILVSSRSQAHLAGCLDLIGLDPTPKRGNKALMVQALVIER